MRPKPTLPKCKALFDYQAQDLDELALTEGDVIDILKEGEFQLNKNVYFILCTYSCLIFLDEGGWWYGSVNGRKGLFPANYVEKI
jgi:myosin I